MLSLQMTPHLAGNVHVQVNPFNSYSADKMNKDVLSLRNVASELDPDFNLDRLSFKIPSTWEGLQACKRLKSNGVKVLATMLFNAEQAALAADVGCDYIAPYINELKVHFEPGSVQPSTCFRILTPPRESKPRWTDWLTCWHRYQDPKPGFDLCAQSQAYFQKHHSHDAPKVMPASLTSIQECMSLAAADHITIAPHLLQKLHETPAGPRMAEKYPSVFDGVHKPAGPRLDFASEADWRLAMTRSDRGVNERKLSEAINVFCDFQEKLERLMRRRLEGHC